MLYDEDYLLAIQKYEILKKMPNTILLNEYDKIIFDPESGLRILMVGDPGKGKSYSMAILVDQFGNVIMLDPTVGGKFKYTLKELGIQDNWEIRKITETKSPNAIKFNIAECEGKEIIDVLFGKKVNNEKQRKQRDEVKKFFRQPREEKTWNNFKKLCQEIHTEHWFDEFKAIFSTKDKGISIEDIQHGKWVFEIELNFQSMSLGLFFAVLKHQRGNSANKKFYGKDFLLIGLDEGQNYARRNTSLGDAIADMYLELRKFGIGFIGAGSEFMGFHPVIRKQWNYGFFFPSKAFADKYRENAIDILPEDFEELPKYGCFLFDRELNIDRQNVLFNTYFLEHRQLLSENSLKTIIEGDTTNFRSVYGF